MSKVLYLAERPHFDPPPARPEETSAERRTRQLAFLRELAELNMGAARAAADRIEQAEQAEQADAATLSLARATRAVTQLFNIENRVAAGEQASPVQPADPRRALLREALHPLTKTEPDPSRRAALRRRMDQAIDDALLADLDDDLPLAPIAVAIAKSLGLHLNLATVSDEFLGMPPRTYQPDMPIQNDRPPGPYNAEPFDPEDDDFARGPP